MHTPEFAFEREIANVLSGAQRLGVNYPIAIDNNYSMFDSYRDQYWSADFLIDATGQVHYFKLGEGDYSTTENHIRELLRAADPAIQLPPPTNVIDQSVTDQRTTPRDLTKVSESGR